MLYAIYASLLVAPSCMNRVSTAFDDQHGVRDALEEFGLLFPLPPAETYLPLPGVFLMRLPPSIGMDDLIDLLWIGN